MAQKPNLQTFGSLDNLYTNTDLSKYVLSTDIEIFIVIYLLDIR